MNLRARLVEDLQVVRSRDPSVRSLGEALLTPGLRAVWAHRVAHYLNGRGHRVIARAIAELSRLGTGIDIHPGAQLGRRVFIDHGCGTVIGETAVLGDDVSLYQNVTLGSRGWWCDAPAQRRHPAIGAGSVIGSGASVLGPITVGANAIVSAHALVLKDVPGGAHIRGSQQPSRVRPAAGRGPEIVEHG
ncbi:MAG: serine acetyltransferase [Actinomycetota bacterium]|nr:serine acetyltransferase [Actinomycetota bacterium]